MFPSKPSSKFFCWENVLITSYYINKSPTLENKSSTHELLFGKIPRYEHLRTFGFF